MDSQRSNCERTRFALLTAQARFAMLQGMGDQDALDELDVGACRTPPYEAGTLAGTGYSGVMVTSAASDGMPFATTSNKAAPVSIPAGTRKVAEDAWCGVTDIEVMPVVRA